MNPDRGRILVDTSAWIIGFRAGGSLDAQEFLRQKIAADQAAVSPLIILELVQGCKTARERDNLRRELESLEILDLDTATWERAYTLAFDLRRKGLAIPTVDILIIAIALEHNLLLLHFDRHFVMAAEHLEDLREMAMGVL